MNKEVLPEKKIGVIGGNIPIKTTSLSKTLNDPVFLQESLIEAIDLCAQKDAEREALLDEIEFVTLNLISLLDNKKHITIGFKEIIQSKRAKEVNHV